MGSSKLLYVYRKRHSGNHSIENLYRKIATAILEQTASWEISTRTLSTTYDIATFLICLLSSLFYSFKVVHVTGGCNYMVMAFPFQKRVLTLHDIIRYNELTGLRKVVYKKVFLAWPCRYSNRIVVVSEHTKVEVLKLFPSLAEKISVIHNPQLLPIDTSEAKICGHSKQPPVILQIGDKPNKNFPLLLEATKDLEVQYLFLHANPDRLLDLVERLQIRERVEIRKHVPIAEMPGIYTQCDMVFFASLAEGFGLPIIEAQSLGVPVITSDMPPMNEVGKGAYLVDPKDPEAIKKAVLELQKTEVRKRVIDRGFINSKRFNLQRIADEYLQLYNSLV